MPSWFQKEEIRIDAVKKHLLDQAGRRQLHPLKSMPNQLLDMDRIRALSLASPRKRALTPTLLNRAKTPVGSSTSRGASPVQGSTLVSLQLPDEVRLLPAEELSAQLEVVRVRVGVRVRIKARARVIG